MNAKRCIDFFKQCQGEMRQEASSRTFPKASLGEQFYALHFRAIIRFRKAWVLFIYWYEAALFIIKFCWVCCKECRRSFKPALSLLGFPCHWGLLWNIAFWMLLLSRRNNKTKIHPERCYCQQAAQSGCLNVGAKGSADGTSASSQQCWVSAKALGEPTAPEGT